MANEKFYAIGGAILGSLAEEGLEEIFPGLGELAYQGEIGGAIAGLIGSEFTKEETKSAIESFVKYAYRRINQEEASENISEEELKQFTEKFGQLPKSKKEEIINNFRNLAPYEYEFIIDFLKDVEAT
jgi:hypothetical protein